MLMEYEKKNPSDMKIRKNITTKKQLLVKHTGFEKYSMFDIIMPRDKPIGTIIIGKKNEASFEE
jgi:hypothetical protein